jgi:hypothetical protein
MCKLSGLLVLVVLHPLHASPTACLHSLEPGRRWQGGYARARNRACMQGRAVAIVALLLLLPVLLLAHKRCAAPGIAHPAYDQLSDCEARHDEARLDSARSSQVRPLATEWAGWQGMRPSAAYAHPA